MARCRTYRIYRTELGRHFSEGARQLWLRALEHKPYPWTQADLMRAVDSADGVVGRWLYGDHRPSPPFAKLLEELDDIRIDRDLWFVPPQEPFVLSSVLVASFMDRHKKIRIVA